MLRRRSFAGATSAAFARSGRIPPRGPCPRPLVPSLKTICTARQVLRLCCAHLNQRLVPLLARVDPAKSYDRPPAPGPPPLHQIRPSRSSASARPHTCVAPRASSIDRASAHGEQRPVPAPVHQWASQFRPAVFFFRCCKFPNYPETASFTENPLHIMHIISHKPCIGLK